MGVVCGGAGAGCSGGATPLPSPIPCCPDGCCSLLPRIPLAVCSGCCQCTQPGDAAARLRPTSSRTNCVDCLPPHPPQALHGRPGDRAARRHRAGAAGRRRVCDCGLGWAVGRDGQPGGGQAGAEGPAAGQPPAGGVGVGVWGGGGALGRGSAHGMARRGARKVWTARAGLPEAS